ncbi:hypothetical protein Pcinc_007605 [Petrolisthes cinctipes]|uniref:Uncharacterized protein n=1 Tax=Petrolisthes cinctipes TaxID=88211 RepID=A0AAE1GAQ6_PETCI|nr:hypothetical protein Pcinc_007605 [Petrolisthes cinctipes]
MYVFDSIREEGSSLGMVHLVTERSQEECFSRFRGVQDVLRDKGEGRVRSRLSRSPQPLAPLSTRAYPLFYDSATNTIPNTHTHHTYTCPSPPLICCNLGET